MICQTCKQETFFQAEFDPFAGIVQKCAKCLATQPKTSSPVAQSVEHPAVNRDGVGSIPAGRATPNNKVNVVKLAKERMKAIRAELKYHKALLKELAELQRLVAAAKVPRPKVRTLHAVK